MKNEALSFHSPLFLHDGFQVPESDPNFGKFLYGGFMTMARQEKVGGKVMNVRAEVKRASDFPPLTFTPAIAPETPIYTVSWDVALSTAQALVWAWDEVGEEYLDEIWDLWPRDEKEKYPREGLEKTCDALMGFLGGLVDDWRTSRGEEGE